MSKMLINKTNVRRLALTIANERAQSWLNLPSRSVDSNGRVWNYDAMSKAPLKKYTQISPTFFDTLDAKVRNLIKDHIEQMPRGGKTIH